MYLYIYLIVLIQFLNSQNLQLTIPLTSSDYSENGDVRNYFPQIVNLNALKEKYTVQISKDQFKGLSTELLCKRVAHKGQAVGIDFFKYVYDMFRESKLAKGASSAKRETFYQNFMKFIGIKEGTQLKDYEILIPYENPHGSCAERNSLFIQKLIEITSKERMLSIAIQKPDYASSLKSRHENCKGSDEKGKPKKECEWMAHIAPLIITEDGYYVFDPTVEKMKGGKVTTGFLSVHDWINFMIQGDIDSEDGLSRPTYEIHVKEHTKLDETIQNSVIFTLLLSNIKRQISNLWFGSFKANNGGWTSSFCKEQICQQIPEWSKRFEKMSQQAKALFGTKADGRVFLDRMMSVARTSRFIKLKPNDYEKTEI